MRRFSMTMTAAAAALALLGAAPLGWASGGTTSGSGGGSGGSGSGGSGGGGSSAPPCFQMSVVATPKIQSLQGYTATTTFITTLTNCGTSDKTVTVGYNLSPPSGPYVSATCTSPPPRPVVQVLVPAGATVVVQTPPLQWICPGDYVVTAVADVSGGSVQVAIATDTFTLTP